MRKRIDLSGFWDGELKLNLELDVATPEIIRKSFYVPLSGFFLWLFFDYEGSSISISGINAKGIVDLNRNPKLAFNMIKNILKGGIK